MANSNNSIDSAYSYIKAIVLTIVYLASLYEARAQVHLVKDINTAPQSSLWGGVMKQAGSSFYFSAYTNQYGNELWKSDGTPGGTVLVKDIYPGTKDSNPQQLTALKGILYFTADDGVHGTELWRSDGTAEGTYLFRESEEGGDASVILQMVATNNELFFNTHKDQAYLWKTDGTSTSAVIDMASIQNLTSAGDAVYFSGSEGAEAELWRTEGTNETTHIVKDITGPNVSTGPSKMINVNGIIYFAAYKQDTGVELWKTDGTEGGTMIVADINANTAHSNPDNLVATGNKLYFTADDGSKGRELWVTDGASTQMVTDLTYNSGSTEFGEMIGVNGSLFFVANTAIGKELWKTDGTAAGTFAIEDIAAGAASSNPSHFMLVNGTIFFSANDNERGVELWKTDGDVAAFVKEIYPGDSSNPSGLFAFGNNLYFWADDGIHGSELWITKSSGETTLLKDIATGTSFSDISSVIADDNHTWFADYHSGVWKTDGTNAGTINIREQMDQTYKNFLKTDDKLYVVTHIPAMNKDQILYSDGTEELVALHYNVFNSIAWIREVDGILYIAGDQPGTGMELWKSNGEFGDVTLVSDINPGAAGSFPGAPFVSNGILYFRADDGQNGFELWKSEGGTALGTRMIKDVYSGPGHGNPQELVASNGKIFFNATSEELGQEVWITDGTEEGTHVVKDIRQGNDWGNPYGFVVFDNTVYFVANDGAHGFELWRTDGTEEGTRLVKDVNPNDHSDADYLTVLDGSLYFAANDGEHGYELWKSDGTGEGTYMLKDITPGADGTELWWFTIVNNHLFFIADNTIWRTNGTECSTMPVYDDPSVTYYDAFMPVGSGNKLYFMGISADAGAELYYYDFSNIDEPGCEQTIAFEEIEAKTIVDTPFELHATTSSGLPVMFESSDENVITINGNIATIVGAGQASITASANGNTEYKPATPVVHTIEIASITGLEEDKDKLVSIYPNPATEFVVIDGSVLRDGALVNLMDINGRLISSIENERKLDVTGLLPGIYIIRVTTKDLTVTKRIVKK